MPKRRHAEVVGGGFAGLVAATALAQRGWSVQLHERSAELRAFGAGIFVWENGLRVLDAIGAGEEVMAASHQAPDYQVRDAENRLLGREVFGPQIGTRMVTMTRQALHAAILNAAIRAGVQFRLASNVLSAEGAGVVHVEDGPSFSADLVVGADGVHSRVRDSLGLLVARTREPFGAIRLLVDLAPGDEGHVVTYRSEGPRRTLYVPCDRKRRDTASWRLPPTCARWRRPPSRSDRSCSGDSCERREGWHRSCACASTWPTRSSAIRSWRRSTSTSTICFRHGSTRASCG